MDESLLLICKALKEIFALLKPRQNPIAFVLVIGRLHQGKSSILKRSEFTNYPISLPGIAIYYHEDGVLLELCESWIREQHVLLSNILKTLNKINRYVHISALVLCVDVQSLFHHEYEVAKIEAEKHVKWVKHFIDSLGYAVKVSVFLTKCDNLVGFLPFFQLKYAHEELKLLGFSVDGRLEFSMLIKQYRQQFDKLIIFLNRQVLQRLHVARSVATRTQIREFPLQLISLRSALQILIETIAKAQITVQGVYWMSAAAHAAPVDRLQHKFADNYNLILNKGEAQSHNIHPAYFIRGAFEQVLLQNKKAQVIWPANFKWMMTGFLCFSILFALVFARIYLHATSSLDEVGQELDAYELLIKNGDKKQTAATFHLSEALRSLEAIPVSMQHLSSVQKLKGVLQSQIQETFEHGFLPKLIKTIEDVMRAPNTPPLEQYQALKIYLSLTSVKYFSYPKIEEWFNKYWLKNPSPSQEKARALLREVLSQPINSAAVDNALINEVQNRLNALPAQYLFYLIAKNSSVNHPEKKLDIPGFVLARTHMPQEMTKIGFKAEIKRLNAAAKAIKEDNLWILARNDVGDMSSLLIKGYCAEYVAWWKQFVKQSRLPFVQNFTAAKTLAKALYAGNSFEKLVLLVQENTSPYQDDNGFVFNDQIASQFTSLSFLSPAMIHDINKTIREMVTFLTTLTMINDDGQTAFAFVKARFQGNAFSDSLSLLYQKAGSLPEPISDWIKGFADSIWTLLVQEARTYLNQSWNSKVYATYENLIANRYPFQSGQEKEVSLESFDKFFAPHGILAGFVEENIRPFIDTASAQWKDKTRDGLVMPISEDMINELIRANIISNMFFASGANHGQIDFSLEKIALDPVVTNLSLVIGKEKLEDSQESHSHVEFHWPAEKALLTLHSLEGKSFSLSEEGLWAFFRMLQKVNVLVDPDNASSLQILFEINGNSGRYVLKTDNQLNPFNLGVLDGFVLPRVIV